MNIFRLCKSLYAGSFVRLVFLFLVMTLSMQSLVVAIGLLRYHRAIDGQIHSIQNAHGVYLMQFELGEAIWDQENIQEAGEKISQLPGVREVIRTRELHVECNNESYTLLVYHEWMAKHFRPHAIRGEWVDSSDSVVISSYGAMRNVIGQKLMLTFRNGSDTVTYPITVQGVMGNTSHVLRLTRSATALSLQDLQYPAYGHLQKYMIVSETSVFYRTFRDAFQTGRNFLVLFEGEIPLQTEQALRAMGLVMDFRELDQNTEKEYELGMFYVRYLLLFSGMSLILAFGMSLSFVREKHRELAVYAICGCRRWQKKMLSSLGVILIATVSFLLQSMVICFFYKWHLYRILENAVIAPRLIGVIAGYTLLICAVSWISSDVIYGKKQLVDVLQENRK